VISIISFLAVLARGDISKTSVVGLVQWVVIRDVTGPFLTGSFQDPVKVQVFWRRRSPVLTMRPVDMLSIQVDQYLPVTLSKPRHAMAGEGGPIIVLFTSST